MPNEIEIIREHSTAVVAALDALASIRNAGWRFSLPAKCETHTSADTQRRIPERTRVAAEALAGLLGELQYLEWLHVCASAPAEVVATGTAE